MYTVHGDAMFLFDYACSIQDNATILIAELKYLPCLCYLVLLFLLLNCNQTFVCIVDDAMMTKHDVK